MTYQKLKQLPNLSLPFHTAVTLQCVFLGAALLPAYIMLCLFHDSLQAPSSLDVLDIASCSMKAMLSTFVFLSGIVLYSDIIFPLVMLCLGRFFSTVDVKEPLKFNSKSF